ncbi:M56 family metallopeptidase [Neorhodopirellula pilleata]|nr:M56 family metallopeptidase [Neorhodopirellula pilleata]
MHATPATPAVSSLAVASSSASPEQAAAILPEIDTNWHVIEATLIVVWAMGMFVGALLFLRSTRRVRQLIRGSLLIEEGRHCDQFIALSKKLGLRKHVKLGVSSEEIVPFVTGWASPVVVLPAGFGNWTSDRLNVVLAHELIHIRRADLFWQTIARWCLIVAWFHPLAWIATWRLRVEQGEDHGDIAPQRLLTWHPVAVTMTGSSLLSW